MGWRRTKIATAVVATSLLVTGCRLDVDTSVRFFADDTAQVTVSAGFDAPLVQQLDRFGLDPLAALMPAQDMAWQLSRSIDTDGLLRVGLSQDGVDVAAVAGVLKSLSVGLADTDVGLRFDVDVTQEGDEVVLSGTALFTPPSTQGVWLDGTPLGLTADQLALQAAEAADVWFSVTAEGLIVEHNADVTETDRVRWRLPVNEPVTVFVILQPAETGGGMLAFALLVITLVLGAGWLVWRQRRTKTPQDETSSHANLTDTPVQGEDLSDDES